MPYVIDASTVVAALLDDGSDGVWAEGLLATGDLAAPHLLPAEVTDILRRLALTGALAADRAARTHARLHIIPVALFPYQPLADRIWELRHNVTAYDAWYVALAEALDAELATLDRRLARARGPRCRFLTPKR